LVDKILRGSRTVGPVAGNGIAKASLTSEFRAAKALGPPDRSRRVAAG
jgi:hypothetical protein